jgi:hypothetical protein
LIDAVDIGHGRADGDLLALGQGDVATADHGVGGDRTLDLELAQRHVLGPGARLPSGLTAAGLAGAAAWAAAASAAAERMAREEVVFTDFSEIVCRRCHEHKCRMSILGIISHVKHASIVRIAYS